MKIRSIHTDEEHQQATEIISQLMGRDLEELVQLMLRVQGYWLLLDRKPERFPVMLES